MCEMRVPVPERLGHSTGQVYAEVEGQVQWFKWDPWGGKHNGELGDAPDWGGVAAGHA